MIGLVLAANEDGLQLDFDEGFHTHDGWIVD